MEASRELRDQKLAAVVRPTRTTHAKAFLSGRILRGLCTWRRNDRHTADIDGAHREIYAATYGDPPDPPAVAAVLTVLTGVTPAPTAP